MMNDKVNRLTYVRKFLYNNIMVPVHGDGNAVVPEHVNVSLGACIVMLAILEDIFAAPSKETRHTQIDDPGLYYNEKWNKLADCFNNAPDFATSNE
jgi:hypothetical protein